MLNDIYLSTDFGDTVVLVLLDLSAAFDTVDHPTLLARLETWVGIKALSCHGSSLTLLTESF